jgi:hypothetical protein
MLALLGLIAVAGYQNRDKIAEMIGGLKGNDRQPDRGTPIRKVAWRARAGRRAASVTC